MKLPPEPSSSDNYKLWRKDIELWKQLTETPKAKMGIALQYACRNNKRIHEAILNIDEAEVAGDEGIENVLKVLDTLHNVDKEETALLAYEEFEALSRKESEKVSEFVLKFEASYKKTKTNGNKLSDELLASKLMRALNLSETDQRIVRTSVVKFDFENVKKVLKKSHGETSYNSSVIKVEPTYQTSASLDGCRCKDKLESHQQQEVDEDTFYASNKWRNKSSNYKHNNYSIKYPSSKNYTFQFSVKQPSKRGKNPLDPQGNVTQCNRCYSINHWIADCPDPDEQTSVTEALHTIVLFEDDDENPDNVKSLVHETMGCAVLDCGAPKTVCGKVWLDTFIEALSKEDQGRVTYTSTSNIYKFGNGRRVKAYTSVNLPVVLGKKEVTLKTDVVNDEIPLLMSRISMKRAKTMLDMIEDKVTMLGQVIKLITTSTGHYAVPICPNRIVLDKDEVNINLLSTNPNMPIKEIATKLHRQFAHPSAERLLRLIKQSKYGSNEELKKEIDEVTNKCSICMRFKQSPPRPVVDMPMATRFNETIAIDIKYYSGKPILYMIDSLTRFSASSVLTSNRSKSVIDSILNNWIAIFGPPGKFVSSNEDFANDEFISMAKSFNITVVTTSSESTWSNDICERYNSVLGEMICEILGEVDCSLSVAVTWATAARNGLQNIHGFSPAQLVLGYNPMLPCVQTDKPPALSEEAYADIVEMNLQAMRTARAAHVNTESSERVRRALNNNTRFSGDVKYVTGDLVYFKRKDGNRWHGPGTVIGQCGQFVLIRNQSSWIRVHPSKLQLVQREEYTKESSGQAVTTNKENPSQGEKKEVQINDTQDLEDDDHEAYYDASSGIPEKEDVRYEQDEDYEISLGSSSLAEVGKLPEVKKAKEEVAKEVPTHEIKGINEKATKKSHNKAKYRDSLKPDKNVKFKLTSTTSEDWTTGPGTDEMLHNYFYSKLHVLPKFIGFKCSGEV